MKVIRFSFILFLMGSGTLSFAQSRNECKENIEKGIKLLGQKQYKKSLQILSASLEHANANQWRQEEYAATNNIGSIYYHLGDFNEAIRFYLQAYELAETSLDKNSQMASINNIAVIYFQDRDFENAYSYFNKAYLLAEELKVTYKQGIYALNIALVSNKMKLKETAWEFIEKAEFLLASKTNEMIRVNLAKAEWHLLHEEIEKAKDLLLQLSQLIEENDLKEDQMLQLMLLSDLYKREGQYELAIAYAIKSLKITRGRENLISAYIALSHLYEKTKNYPLALKYMDSVVLNKDTLFNTKMKSGFETNKIKFQFLDSQRQLRQSKLEAAKNKVLFYSILSIVFLLCIIGFILFRNYKEKQRQHKKLSDLNLAKKRSENLLLEKQLKEKEALAQLENERYKNEMDAKNREIVGKAFVQSSQTEAIQKLVDTIENDAFSEKLDGIQSDLEHLKSFLKQSNHWQTFFLHFEKTNPGFIQRLSEKHPTLTANELRFITYIYINLSNKEISQLLNISYSSVRKRKERLSKKLDLGSSTHLYPYLLGI